MNLFWIHRDILDAMGVERGFGLFSLPHLIWIGLMAAMTVLVSLLYGRAGERGRDNLRKGLALFLILFEIFKQCLMVLTGAPPLNYLPLDVCSYGEYVILADALWPQNRPMKQLLAFAFLPAAFMALLLPTVTVYPPVNFYTIHQFVMHGAIVAYSVARYAAGEIRPRYRGLWMTLLVFILLAAAVYRVNLAFDTNYMFLNGPFGNPVLKLLWNMTGGAGGNLYVLSLIGLVTLVLHIMYAFFVLPGLLRRRKQQ